MDSPYLTEPVQQEGLPGWGKALLVLGAAYFVYKAFEKSTRPARNTYRYRLVSGRKIVYHGISNDPWRRVAEHARDGKLFNAMEVIGCARTRAGASRSERESINTYRSRRGRLPKYNMV